MFRLSIARLSAAAVNSPGSSGSAASVSAEVPVADYKQRVADLCTLMGEHRASHQGVVVRPSEELGRGLFADCVFREGTTLLSVPMHQLTISADRLLESSEHLRLLKPPTLDDVCRLMTARSIQDPVLYEQVHLALLVAGEHMNMDSPLSPYFNTLPHPAMDDAAVIKAHKDVLDPMVLVEWDDYQREFLAVLHILLRRWGSQAPPIELAYWALRTVLSRMHMLPSEGTAPEDVGSTLSYTALSTVERAERQTRWLKRAKATLSAVLGGAAVTGDYRLAPTLVPLLDMAGHLPSSNVQVEVVARPGVGSCVELQAIREINKGEEIGMRFNSSQTPAFSLYRFGFIPQ